MPHFRHPLRNCTKQSVLLSITAADDCTILFSVYFQMLISFDGSFAFEPSNTIARAKAILLRPKAIVSGEHIAVGQHPRPQGIQADFLVDIGVAIGEP